jgi:hypothetical protein
MKYKIAIAGFLLFLVGFVLASRAYNFVCNCTTSNPINDLSPCYQCMNSPKYQNNMLVFQVMMIVSVFIVLYGFFSEFDYESSKSTKK